MNFISECLMTKHELDIGSVKSVFEVAYGYFWFILPKKFISAMISRRHFKIKYFVYKYQII